MSDILTNFKKQIDNFPKNPSDLNIICTITYAEYKAVVSLLDTLLFPHEFVKRNLQNAITLIDNQTYNFIIDNLNKLNVTLKSVLPEPFNKNMTMDINVSKFGDMLSSLCMDFMGSLPESLFNIFQDVKHGLIDITKLVNGLLSLPSSLASNIVKSLLDIKDQALKNTMGALFDTILYPLIAYEEFIKENGILYLLDKMKKTERCMTKPGICNRPRADFIHPDSKKVYSTHYSELFFINGKGNINIKSFGGTSAQKSKISNILKNMNSFRLTVR